MKVVLRPKRRHKIRRAPQPGDILLFTNARGWNLCITLFTRSPYYHVGIYAGEGHILEMRVRGALLRDLRGHDGGRYFVVIPAPSGKGAQALAWAQSKMHSKYDYDSIRTLVLDRVFRHLHLNFTPNSTYTCSEFVAEAFVHAGVRLFPAIESAATVPGDFGRFVPRGTRPQTFCRQRAKRNARKARSNETP